MVAFLRAFGERGRRRINTTCIGNLLSRIGKHRVLPFHSGATITNVGHEHVGIIALERIRTATGSTDHNIRAVHIHLPITHQVEPGPGKQGLTVGHIARHLEVIFGLQGASAHHGIDDFEGLAIIVAERQLAGSSTVSGGTGQRDVVGVASGVFGGGAPGGVLLVAFAREVRT